MALPVSIDAVLTSADSWPSSIANKLQEGVVALWGGGHAPRILSFSSIDGVAIAGTFTRGTANGTLSVLHPNGGGSFAIYLKGLPVGTIVTKVDLDHFGNGATDASVSFKRFNKVTPLGSDIVSTVNITNPPASWQTTPLTVVNPAVAGLVGANDVFAIMWAGTTGVNFESGNVAVTCFHDG